MNKSGGIKCSNFKPYYKATLTKQHDINRKPDTQTNGTVSTVSPDKNPHIQGHTYIMTKEAKIYKRERKDSSINGLGKLDSQMQKVKLDHYLTTDTKINPKFIGYLNVRPETIKYIK